MTKEYIVIAFTENQIGVLNRITAREQPEQRKGLF